MRRAEKYIQAADICGSTASQSKKRNNDSPHERGKRMRRPMDDKEDRDDYKFNANRREIFLDIKHTQQESVFLATVFTVRQESDR